MVPLFQRVRYPLLLTAVVICFFWKLLFTGHYTWFQAPDFANQVLPWYQFQAGEWHAGRIPLWSPYEWTGHSFIGQSQTGVADPLNLLLFAMPLNENGWIRQWALHWFYVASYLCAVLAFYAFARRAIRLSSPAACVAALGYGLGGVCASANWPQMTHATSWAMLALLFQFQAVREDRPILYGAWSGAMLGMLWFCGHHQIPIYMALASFCLWIYFLYTRFVTKPGILRGAAMAGLFLALFGMLQILPAVEYGHQALRWVGHDEPVGWADKIPYRIHGLYSMRPHGLLGTFIKTYEGYNPFLGVTLLSMTAFGIATRWRDSSIVRLLVWIGGVAILFAFGSNGFLQGPLYALVPMIEKTRVPAVGMILFQIAAAALAGVGIDALARNPLPLTRRFAQVALWTGALLTATNLALLFYLGFRTSFLTTEFTLSTGAVLLVAAVFRFRPAWTPALLAAGVLIELSTLNGGDWEDQGKPGHARFAEDLAQNADIAAFLASRSADLGRIEQNFEFIPFSFGDWWGLETVEAMAASIPTAFWSMEPFHPETKRFASVRYTIGRRPPAGGLHERFRGKSGLNVYEDPAVFPRAWLVHDVKSVDSVADAKAWMITRGEARRTEAIVQSPVVPPKLESCNTAGESAQFLHRVPNHLTLLVKAGCRSMLIVNDAWYPGWRAEVDGHPTTVYQADGFARGVVVEKGTHRVDLVFRPASVMTGAAFLVIGIVGLAIVTRIQTRGHSPKPQTLEENLPRA